jgi:hypothetical protein
MRPHVRTVLIDSAENGWRPGAVEMSGRLLLAMVRRGERSQQLGDRIDPRMRGDGDDVILDPERTMSPQWISESSSIARGASVQQRMSA